jgi:hypothetical protein
VPKKSLAVSCFLSLIEEVSLMPDFCIESNMEKLISSFLPGIDSLDYFAPKSID